jgi:hypothetical protein
VLEPYTTGLKCPTDLHLVETSPNKISERETISKDSQSE